MLHMVAAGGSGTKPAGKGVDLEAVGNIKDVPVYEFDLDGVKDKPWRKPGMLCHVFCCCCDICIAKILPLQSKQVPRVLFLLFKLLSF